MTSLLLSYFIKYNLVSTLTELVISAWLNDSAHPSLAYLTRLVSALTNLTMDSAEPWQVNRSFLKQTKSIP